MFLGGVEHLVAETRPASIMGILRYWYRVLIANKYASDYGINSPRDWEDYKKWALNKGKTLWERVYEDEGKLFGTQERAGKVRIRMEYIMRRLSSSDVRKWTDGEFAKKVSYIGYGPILYVNLSKDRYRHLRNLYPGNDFGPVRGFFTSDSRLTEPVKVLRDIRVDFIVDDETIFDKLIGLLWFVSMFGSLGSRSRKGWGSFHLIQEGDDHGFKSWEFQSIDVLKKDLVTFMDLMKIESLGNLEIYFAELKGGDLLSFMSEFSSTYKDFLTQNLKNLKKLERSVYGLPRGFKGLRIEMKGYKRDYKILIEWSFSYIRRASMIHFKGVKFDGGYGVLIVRKREPLIYDELRNELNNYLADKLKKEIKNLEKKDKRNEREERNLETYKRLLKDKEGISRVANSVVDSLKGISPDDSFEKLVENWNLTEVYVPR